MKAPGSVDRAPHIAYLAPELGALTSTFIYREVAALRHRGVSVVLFSTARPADPCVSDDAKPVINETRYLYDQSPAQRFFRAFAYVVRHPLPGMHALSALLRDAMFARTPEPSDRLKMAWHFVTGACLASELESRGIQHLHAHFAHVPTAISMYAALLADIPFSFTAHANDIFERGTALREKVDRSAFAAVISEYNRRFLQEEGCRPDRIHVVRCGLDPARYTLRTPPPANTPPLLFSVGRFVEKKGFHILVAALGLLKERNVPFRCLIAGDGPLYAAVRTQADGLGLSDALEMPGSVPQERVRDLFDRADLFVLPCVEANSGDRDGIPVALMEAMALGVPVVSTRVSGIPELVTDGENGLLVSEGDAPSLAAALERLLNCPELRVSLSANARETIEKHFNLETIAADLESLFCTAHTTRNAPGESICPK